MTYRLYVRHDAGDELLTAIFPASFANLLDEQLDEASISVYDEREVFAPLTEMRLDIREDSQTVASLYFVVANDRASMVIPGRATRKHDLYLIERTKILEGYLCQSITFTNASGSMYTDAAVPAFPTYSGSVPFTDLVTGHESEFGEILTPVAIGSNVTIPSMATVTAPFIAANPQFVLTSANVLAGTIYHAEIGITQNGQRTTHTMNTDDDLLRTFSFSATHDPVTVEYVAMFYLADTYDAIGTKITYSLRAIENQYPLKDWTIPDCIERCLKLASPLYGTDSPRFIVDASVRLKYGDVAAPEFSMSSCTLREQLKVIGGFIHCEPRLTATNTIVMQPLAEQGKAADHPFIQSDVSQSINQYCTGVRTSAQNLVQSLKYATGVMIDPARGNGTTAYRSVRTEMAYTRVTESNAYAPTQNAIYTVEKVMCGILNVTGDTPANSWYIKPVEITPYVFEATEYNGNLTDYDGSYPKSKAFAIYYTLGQPGIRGMFYRAPRPRDLIVPQAYLEKYSIVNILSALTSEHTIQQIDDFLSQHAGNLVFQISYRPIFSALLSHEKQAYTAGEKKFEQPYAQGENLIESLYYGENIKGVSARLGNVDEERTFLFKHYSDIPTVAQTIDGKAISAVHIQLLPNAYKATVALTRDFNRISQFVGVDSQKHIYEVSERNTYDRSVLLKSYLVVGGSSGDTAPFSVSVLPFRRLLTGTNEADKSVTMAVAQGKSFTGANLTSVSLPVMASALGNAMLFSFRYEDNYSAGKKGRWIDDNVSGSNIRGVWMDDVRYTDYYGRMKWLRFNLYTSAAGSDLAVPPMDLPNATRGNPADGLISMGADYLIDKDSREKISINYEIECKTANPDLVIGSAMAYLCDMVNPLPVPRPKLYLMLKPPAVSKFAREIPNLPASSDLVYGVADFTVGNATNNSFSLDPFVSSVKVYGWIIAIPPYTETRKVLDTDGTVKTETRKRGGDVLLSSFKEYAPGENLFANTKFVIKNQ